MLVIAVRVIVGIIFQHCDASLHDLHEFFVSVESYSARDIVVEQSNTVRSKTFYFYRKYRGQRVAEKSPKHCVHEARAKGKVDRALVIETQI